MPKRKSLEDLFRKARENGSENNKHIVTGEEVKKELQPGTLKRYPSMTALWKQFRSVSKSSSDGANIKYITPHSQHLYIRNAHT